MIRTCLSFVLLLLAADAAAQQVNDVRDLVPRRMEFGGHTEVFTEGYAVNGRDPRRPWGTARLLLRPYLRIGEAFELSADVLLSTEQRSLDGAGRQRINRVGIRPVWSWGSATFGDFSHAYTPHTYQGIPIRGAALDLHPGLLRFAALGGVTQRAVAGDASNGSFGRQLYAGRIGVGSDDGSYFDLLALWADDDAGSLEQELVYDDVDTTQVGSVAPTSVTPQQNLVLGTATQLSGFDRRLVWHGEFTAAAYTRDKRASEIDEAELRDVPSWLTSIFTPRNGSNLDYAWATDLRLRIPGWDLMTEYEYVGPGYRSLGVGSLLVDRRALRGRVAYQSPRLSATLNGSSQSDNVLDQKQDTTRRNSIGGTLNFRPRPNLLTTFQANLGSMTRSALDADQRIDYLNQLWGIGGRLSIRHGLVRSAGMDYQLQDARDDNPARSASNFDSHQVVFPVGLQLSRSLQLTPQVGIVWLRSQEDDWRTTHTESLSLRHTGMDRRWTSTLTAGTTFADGSRRLTLSLRSALRISPQTSLTLVVRNNVYRSPGDPNGDWEEVIGRLTLENQW